MTDKWATCRRFCFSYMLYILLHDKLLCVFETIHVCTCLHVSTLYKSVVSHPLQARVQEVLNDMGRNSVDFFTELMEAFHHVRDTVHLLFSAIVVTFYAIHIYGVQK